MMLMIMMIPVVYLVRGQLIVHDCSKPKKGLVDVNLHRGASDEAPMMPDAPQIAR